MKNLCCKSKTGPGRLLLGFRLEETRLEKAENYCTFASNAKFSALKQLMVTRFEAQKIKLTSAIFLMALCTVSCKYEKSNKEVEATDNMYSKNVSDTAKKAFDLLIFKVKEEDFGDKGLDIAIKSIFIKPSSRNEYSLQIDLRPTTNSAFIFDEYYLIFNIYPLDDEVDLLKEKRRKYNFETFSIKIKTTGDCKWSASRKIKTKLRRARAITLSALSYGTKEKHMEIVLKNVSFLN